MSPGHRLPGATINFYCPSHLLVTLGHSVKIDSGLAVPPSSKDPGLQLGADRILKSVWQNVEGDESLWLKFSSFLMFTIFCILKNRKLLIVPWKSVFCAGVKNRPAMGKCNLHMPVIYNLGESKDGLELQEGRVCPPTGKDG